MSKLDWSHAELIEGDVVTEIKKLKNSEGPEIHVHGSGNLIQTLLKHDLVDEFWLKIFPITLGQGKRLFAEGSQPLRFTIRESEISHNGVIIATYARAGELITGTFAHQEPSEAELARRKKLKNEEMREKNQMR